VRRSTLFFFFGLVVIVVVIARYNSRSRLAEESARAASPNSLLVPSATPSPVLSATVSATPAPKAVSKPALDPAKIAARVQPAVVSISVFEPSGKLLRTGTGLFVSNDGRVLTTRSLLEGAAHAIVKTSDNRIHNVTGILTDNATDDLALLNMETKDSVTSITPNTVVPIEEGAQIAIVQSASGRAKVPVLEGTISKKHKAVSGEWVELSTAVAGDAMGAPVVNETGEVIGLVTRGPGEPAVAVRTSATLNAVLARAPIEGKGRWFVEEAPQSPAEAPLRKIPLAQNPQGRQSKLIYSPAPPYPNAAGTARGSGRFRLSFNASGQVKNIMILKSTSSGILDRAAIDTLRRWKAEPGQEWDVNVPVDFR
jgi:TonB family protein